ncbi:MAG: ribonuclease Z [Muribaculaceae bacterium]|nr:ribonuclease Z [Muribaculaceae bacterium]
MAKFRINILGCGSATPSALHNPSCQVIDFRDRLMMIDCGEGAQVQMRKMNLRFQRLTDIFISHLHGDHCFGLPGLLSTMALHEKGGAVRVHIPQQGMELFRSFVNYFCKETPYSIIFEPITGEGGVLYEDHALTVEAFPLYHRIPCYGFIFREKPKTRHLDGEMVRFYNIPVSQLKAIKEGADYITPEGDIVPNSRLTTPADPSRSYAYCSDTMFDERVAQAVKGVDLLYHEATYGQECEGCAAERGHSTARQAAVIAREAGVKSLLIGHYSKRYRDFKVLVDEARTEFEAVTGADEGLKIDLL